MIVYEFNSRAGLVTVNAESVQFGSVVDPDTEVEINPFEFLMLRLVRSDSWTKGGLFHVMGVTVKNDYTFMNSFGTGLLSEDEAEALRAWLLVNGPLLVAWMRRCPFINGRGYIPKSWHDPKAARSAIGR